jgi:hypothetical protein
MIDRLDSRIRALVVALVDQPVEPPPFPDDLVADVVPTSTRRRAWRVALAAFVAATVIGAMSIVVLQQRRGAPVADVPPEDVVEQMVTSLNAGDLDGVLAVFADDASCVSPGLPGCRDMLEFLVAADAKVTFTGCEMRVQPYLHCEGFVHTSIHDALGISPEALAATPNFPPAFTVEDGRITRFNFSSPFTGDQGLDAQLWAYLVEIDAQFVDESGVPLFSADIVPPFIEAARGFADSR